MTKPLTAIHHSASKLWNLIYRRNWRAAYQAADELDMVIDRENGEELVFVYTATTVTDLAEERFKRAQFH